jgi:hypothetical protein
MPGAVGVVLQGFFDFCKDWRCEFGFQSLQAGGSVVWI